MTASEPEASPARTMLMIQIGEIIRMRAQAVGQRPAAFEDAQDVENDEAEAGALGQFGGDGERAIERDARFSSVESSWVKNRTSRRLRPPKDGSLISIDVPLGCDADVDRRQALFAQLARDDLFVVAGEAAGAHFAVGGDGAKKKVAIYLGPRMDRMHTDKTENQMLFYLCASVSIRG